MKKITEIFEHKDKTFSFELFPPKTEKGLANLLNTIKDLSALEPDFISCTYGAGGGSRDKTLDVVEHIQNEHNIPAVAHLTCVMHTKQEIKDILIDIKSRGIQNILALRGDPPADNPSWKPAKIIFISVLNYALLPARSLAIILESELRGFLKDIISQKI